MRSHDFSKFCSSTPDASQSHAFAIKDSRYQSNHIVVNLAILKIGVSSYMVFLPITRRINLLLLILKAKQ